MIFLDTGYFKGLIDKKDAHHYDSLEIKDYILDSNETTVINTTVLVETLNKVVGINGSVKEMYDNLLDENELIPLTNADYFKSLEIKGWYSNSINYSDCTILTTMMNLGIRQIVSFDEAFKKIGWYNVISSV